MPKQPATLNTSRESGQYSLDLPSYLVRIVPQWAQPSWYEATFWRRFVLQQPVAMAAREYLLSSIISLEWIISSRSDQSRDELKSEVDAYTDLFNHLGGLDYAGYIEWIGGDLLDLPFGGASELGREGDRPEGDVLWVLPLDASTLFPTLDSGYPVGQKLQDSAFQQVIFPAHAINRVYFSPRSEIRREGYGMAPPEKIYLAMSALGRGDIYYANLLLDTPEAGILDLGDMSKQSALEWLDSFRTMINGIDPLKVPVLYEHANPVKYIPFGRPPTELMFDEITKKYAALTCSGYGISLGDIGLSQSASGGATLAGSIRDERKGRHTGIGRLKRKFKAHFDAMLPDTLEFRFIDYDDERALTLGRARMASATAFGQMIANRYIAPQEARSQMIADGLITIPIPEDVPEDASFPAQASPPTRDRQIGFNQSPSLGGHGDITAQRAQYLPEMKGREELQTVLRESFSKVINKATPERLERLIRKAIKLVYPQISQVNKNLNADERKVWRAWYGEFVYGRSDIDPGPIITQAVSNYDEEMDKEIDKEDDWWVIMLPLVSLLSIYLASYQTTLQQAANEMVRQLFAEGLIDSPEILQPFRLENLTIRQNLEQLAKELQAHLTDGTRFFIRRSILSVVKDALTRADVAGVDIDTLLADNVFMAHLVEDVRAELAIRFRDRADLDAEFEIGNIENLAVVEEYRRSGLRMKHWVCYGPDPCELCLENQSHGFVPLSFIFKAVYGDTHSPKAHNRCHCGLEYNTEDLHQAFNEGNFNLWYGE